MKRIIAIISAVAAICSLASCTVTSNMTPEEQLSYHNAKEQEAIEESMRIEEEIIEEIESVDDEIGKTVKNKKIVLERISQGGTTKRVIYMDKKGKAEYTMIYQFFNDPDIYASMRDAGDNGDDKQIKHNDEKRMIVYKNTKGEIVGAEFDVLYENYKTYGINGYKLVE